jgi:hypothetical protein
VPTYAVYRPSAAAAAKRASTMLELRDTSRLSIALAEAAADELTRNAAFVRRVREIYDQLPEKAPRAPREDPLRALKINLIPLRPDANYQVNPSGPADPYDLLAHFGAHQLAVALGLFSLSRLQVAAKNVQANHPGTKPTNGRQKASVIAYIVEQLTATS